MTSWIPASPEWRTREHARAIERWFLSTYRIAVRAASRRVKEELEELEADDTNEATRRSFPLIRR
jgi:hypothetical protein